MTIAIEISQVIAALTQLQGRCENMQPVFDGIGQRIANNIRLNLGVGLDSWGNPFEPLKKPRKTDNGFGKGVPLNDTRQHIFNKITFNPGHDGVEIGILEPTPIGMTHQFGSEKKNIPARPFMPIVGNQVDMPSDWNAEIMRIIDEYFADV